jgi:PEP-CTERM/exosortase A-associated glycosyltransferase
MKRLRILHVLNHSLPTSDGYVFRTLAILAGQRALGFETFHLTAPRHEGASQAEEDVGDWHFYRTFFKARALTKLPVAREVAEMCATARRIDEVVSAVRPDVLHVHSPVLNALPALYVGRRHRIPVVYEVRALWEDGAVDHGTSSVGGLKYRMSRAAESFALRHADAITTICNGLKQDIAARGIAADKITVIPNGVNVAAFKVGQAPDPQLLDELKLRGCFVIGYVGSFYRYEGVDMIIDVVARLAHTMPQLRALLVGGGMQDEALRAKARALGVADKVLFVGRVPNTAVGKYYDLIDFLIYPRRSMRLTELVTPLKPLEAMAQGRLVVASDVGGHRELIADRQSGLLFKADDVESLAALIERYADTPDETRRIREQARRYVEQERSWARSVENYREVFRPWSG